MRSTCLVFGKPRCVSGRCAALALGLSNARGPCSIGGGCAHRLGERVSLTTVLPSMTTEMALAARMV